MLYLVRPGHRLPVRNQSLTVTDNGHELMAFPPGHLDRIELWPGTEADAPALRLALRDGGEVALVDAAGQTEGRFAATSDAHAALHLEQARHALDPDLRLDLARCIAYGKLRNQATLLKRLNRTRHDSVLADAANRIEHLARRLREALDTTELMGFEGAAAAIYWPAWGTMLRHGRTFDLRRRRPAPDPVNAALSLAAALLYRDFTALTARHGLHPGFGELHTARNGQPALLSDLIEEFRAPLVDGFVRMLLNGGTLQPEHFVTGIDRQSRLVPEGHSRVIAARERGLARTVKSPRNGQAQRWRRLIEEQITAYRAHVEGGQYQPPNN
jgi:CRISPR-associated protein Cas1